MAEKKNKGFISKYSEEIKTRLNNAINRKPFNYDVNKDKLFGSYKTQYERAGRRAMEDTVGNAALLTGGYGNSYGVVAGQQVYNDYMKQLADKVPELEQLAYNRYKEEEESAYKSLSQLLELENTQYDRYRDTVEDDKDSRDFEYQKQQDAIDNANEDRNYQLALAKLNSSSSGSSGNSSDDNSEDETKSGKEKFDVAGAYDFIKKYDDVFYTDEELVEALYLLFGEQEGFLDWMEDMTIKGDPQRKTYLDLLIPLHPEVTADLPYVKDRLEQALISPEATPGAAIPSSLNSLGLSDGTVMEMRKPRAMRE